MSKLEELIQQYCPKGVEYRPLKEILKIKNGRDYKHLSEGSIPVYGSGGIMTYVDTPMYDKPSVLIPRKGSIDKLYYVDTPFWNVDTVFYTEIDKSLVIEKYVFYVLQKEHLEKLNTAGGVPSLTQSVLNKVVIPVLPLPVQEEIVRILDTFTELQAELQAELQKRKQQYNYYRDNLLSFEGRTDVEWKKLGEICQSVKSGKCSSRAIIGAYPVYGSTGIISYSGTYQYDTDNILIARVGANAGYVHIARGKYDVTDNTLVVTPKESECNFMFIYYFLFNLNINKYAKGGGQPLITGAVIKDLEIPVPSLSEQQKIVDILDHFDTLTTDLATGLPAEIEKRKQQYEYYRDKLLTFKRKES